MTIITGLRPILSKITSAEIVSYLSSNYSHKPNFIADAINLDRTTGESNNTPKEPSTIGTNSLIDNSNYWTTKNTLILTRRELYNAALTSDVQLSYAGYNGTHLVSTEKYTLSSNTSVSRGNINIARSNTHSAANLTSDLALMFGGYNTAAVLSTTERHSDSVNTWTNTGATGLPAKLTSGISLTSDICINAGGQNGLSGASISNTCERYSNSGVAWVTLTALPGAHSQNGTFSLTSDLSCTAGGYNGAASSVTYRFGYSVNSWVSRNNGPEVRLGTNGVSSTSDLGLVFGGRSTPFSSSMTQFSESMNSWSSKTESSVGARRYTGTSSFSSSQCLVSGGDNGAIFNSNEVFTNNLTCLIFNTNLSSNSLNDTPAVPNPNSAKYVITKKLLSNIPSEVIVGMLTKNVDPNTKVDISANGGTTWDIVDKSLNTVINTSGLSGNDFRLRFKLANLNANTWTSRTGASLTAAHRESTSLTKDTVLSFGGYNGSIYLTTTERFSDSANSWTSFNGLSFGRGYHGSGSLTSDLSLSIGGANGTPVLVNVDRFSVGSNSWLVRANITAKYLFANSSMTNDLIFAFGGYNSTAYMNDSARYSDSANSWTTRQVQTGTRGYHGGCSLTRDTAIITGGFNGSVRFDITERYSDSANSWVTRATLIYPTTYNKAAPLTTNTLIRPGGARYVNGASSVTVNHNDRYDDAENAWSAKAELNTARYGISVATIGSGNALTNNGIRSSTYYNLAEKYNSGETEFKGFGLRYN